MTRFDPTRVNVNSGDWKLVNADDYRRIYQMDMGDGQILQRTEWLSTDELLELNKQEFNDSEGKRWGDGKVAARIPLNVLYNPQNQLVEKMREGDRDHLRWWLNHSDNRMFRTFKGQI